MKIDRLAKEQSVIVCCGAGGVGKTTIAHNTAYFISQFKKILYISFFF